jgi:hypothetical protein
MKQRQFDKLGPLLERMATVLKETCRDALTPESK